MKLSMVGGFGVGIALVLSVGCAAPAEESNEDRVVESTESAIKGGASDFAHPHVAALLSQVDGGYAQSCSGTLIAPNVVLTAAHCTTGLTRIPVSFDQNLRTASQNGTLTVVWGNAVSHPGYDPNGDGARDRKDIGVVVLDSSVSAPLAKLPKAGVLDRLALNQSTPMAVLGYGLDYAIGLGYGGYNNSFERKIANKFFSALAPTAVKVGGGDGNSCFGDSGGPTFMNINGVETLVGVNIIGDGSCAGLQFSYRTDIAASRSFLSAYVTLP
jgi:secreted trypsin-like serine protease